MAGAAITIGLQQLKGFLGITTFTKKTDVVSVMRSVWTTVHHGVRLNSVSRRCLDLVLMGEKGNVDIYFCFPSSVSSNIKFRTDF